MPPFRQDLEAPRVKGGDREWLAVRTTQWPDLNLNSCFWMFILASLCCFLTLVNGVSLCEATGSGLQAGCLLLSGSAPDLEHPVKDAQRKAQLPGGKCFG